ncbi:protein of unknown function [Nitrospira japonica]|uniref:Uncharacterized protein n=1 Tax=Nitrospira japonica TaxID=1325564 RepID=A0A1W1I5E3_9BACT|nr:protein of unknown function [Nitrospira japonica]
MKSLKPLPEHLQFTQEAELLKLHIAEEAMGLRALQYEQQQSTVYCNLMGLTHDIYSLSAAKPATTIDSGRRVVNCNPLDQAHDFVFNTRSVEVCPLWHQERARKKWMRSRNTWRDIN